MKGKTLDNPMPGTVMDLKVTKPYYQDFYLVSQYVRQGTVTPSHFIVLETGDLSQIAKNLNTQLLTTFCITFFAT